MTRFRPLRRCAAAVCLAVLSAGAVTPPARPTVAAVVPSSSAAERYLPEVRLRKMHLVRPDLIPYPISFAVYC